MSTAENKEEKKVNKGGRPRIYRNRNSLATTQMRFNRSADQAVEILEKTMKQDKRFLGLKGEECIEPKHIFKAAKTILKKSVSNKKDDKRDENNHEVGSAQLRLDALAMDAVVCLDALINDDLKYLNYPKKTWGSVKIPIEVKLMASELILNYTVAEDGEDKGAKKDVPKVFLTAAPSNDEDDD